MIKRKPFFALVIFALIFLFNPNVNLIDVLPDCIAYLLLIIVIKGYSESIPYVAECKKALTCLLVTTLVKIPAFSVMYSNMKSGKDIVPLFTLVFATVELILLCSLITNAFKALGYLGERTDCASVRSPFRIGRKGECTPESVRVMTFIFFFAKALLGLVPELFLLTPEETELRRKLTEAYPAMLVICILISLVNGIIWLAHVLGYVRAIRSADDIEAALNLIADTSGIEADQSKLTQKKLHSSLTLFAISGIFIFDISFSDFGGYNVLPHFIYAFLLYAALLGMTKCKKSKLYLTIATGGVTVASIATLIANSLFFEQYGLLDLAYSKDAVKMYLAVKIFTTIETVFMIGLLLIAACISIHFLKEHTDISINESGYGESNRKNHIRLINITYPIYILSAIIHILKCLNVFIKQDVRIVSSEVNPDGIVTSSLPAITPVIIFACIIYVIYSFVISSTLKEEVGFKYGKNN